MPLLLDLAWRNIWRHRRRSILTVAAIAFATAVLVFMLSWQLGNYEVMIDTAVRLRTGHVQVQDRGWAASGDVWRTIPDPGAVARILDGLPGVAAYTVRASAPALLSAGDRACGGAVIGVDRREATVSTLPTLVREGSYIGAGDVPEAVVGRILAHNLRLAPGDELTILGQGADGSVAADVVRVRGILASGEDELDRTAVVVPLPRFQQTFAMGGAVHQVVVLADSLSVVSDLRSRLAAGLAHLPADGGADLVALDWQQLQPGLLQAIQIDMFSGFVFYAILVVVVAFSILNTFLMAVFERTRELGVMLAIGCSPRRLTALLWLESAGMTVLGSALGIALGSAVTLYFHAHGIVFDAATELARLYGLPDRMTPQLSWVSVGVGAGLVLAVCLLTAAYPTLKVRRLRPVRAMADA